MGDDLRVRRSRVTPPAVAPAPDGPAPHADGDRLGLLALQRSAGNAAVAALLGARPAARGPVIQRMFLPVQEVAHEEKETVLVGYTRLLAERIPAVRKLATKVPEPDPELDRFNKAVELFVTARKEHDDVVAWTALQDAVANANALEEKARSAGARVRATPSALSELEVGAVWDVVRHDFPRAEKLCRALGANETYVSQIFAAEVVGRARAGMLQIADQFPRYLAGNIVVDVDRTLDSSGTVLQNAGRGALDQAKMTVTKAWADKDELKRVAGLVHEASHGAATQTSDQAYLDTWSFDTVAPEQQLTNAPHYEAVAELALRLRTAASKPLASNVARQHEPKLRVLLGRADFGLTRRRLRTSRILRLLNESRAGGGAVAPGGEDLEPVGVIGHALGLPYAPRDDRPGYIAATNLDVELFGLFRGWLETIHKTLSRIERLDVANADEVVLSGDRAALTVPYTWARAEEEDVESFLECLARCLPTVGRWPADALVAAMKSLPRS
jgi:hypothetical protein